MNAAQKRISNRLAHLGGQFATSHATLVGLAPLHVREADDREALPTPLEREWGRTLEASEALQVQLRTLGDALAGSLEGDPTDAVKPR